MPYHIRITPTDLGHRQRDIVALDKDAEWIERHIAGPRRRGESIFIDGQTLAWAFIDEIHITETDRISCQILPEVRAFRRSRAGATPMSDEWYVAHEGRDVTEQFLSGPPGTSPEDDSDGTALGAADNTPGVAAEPDAESGPRRILDFLSTPHSTAVMGIAGLVLSGVGLVKGVPTLAALGGVVAISFLVVEILNRRRPHIVIGALAVTLLAGLASLRYYANPGTTYFGYDDALMSGPSRSPFAGYSEIPLTADPLTGAIYSSIPEGDGGYTELWVSCLQTGHFHHREVLWVSIVGGPYKSLWIPWDYLAGIQPGSARTILPCSDWRWRLQNG